MTNITIIISSNNTTQFYRKPHDVEIADYDSGNWNYKGDGYRLGKVRGSVLNSKTGLPEVYAVNRELTILNCSWQRFWRNLNPQLSDGKWSSLLGNAVAWTNRTGFPGRHNCITGEDSTQNLPALNSAIINGGAILKGTVQGSYLLLDNLLSSMTPPPIDDALQNFWWWYWGTGVLPSGKVTYITRLGTDGNYHPVRVPFITDEPIKIPLDWLHKLPVNSPIPDARWLAV